MNVLFQAQGVSRPYTDTECPKTTRRNARTEVMHQNKQAPAADFRLQLQMISKYDRLFLSNSSTVYL